MENSPIITLDHVSAAYDGLTVLDDATLQVTANDFLGIIGPNGGGKTTLVKVILGLIAPTAGTVRFWRDGRPCDALRTGAAGAGSAACAGAAAALAGAAGAGLRCFFS